MENSFSSTTSKLCTLDTVPLSIPLQSFLSRQSPTNTSLLDLYRSLSLSSRQSVTPTQHDDHIEALAQKLSEHSLQHKDLPSVKCPRQSRISTLPRPNIANLQNMTQYSPTTGASRDSRPNGSVDRHDSLNIRLSESVPRSLPLGTWIEAEDTDSSVMEVDEGYCEGTDVSAWLGCGDHSDSLPHSGPRMGGLVNFRTSAETALRCSRLVHRVPRMRKRRHRSHDHEHQDTDGAVSQEQYHDAKRIRQV